MFHQLYPSNGPMFAAMNSMQMPNIVYMHIYMYQTHDSRTPAVGRVIIMHCNVQSRWLMAWTVKVVDGVDFAESSDAVQYE